ncbi:MAG TPA: UPF0280 family protein [Coriobacteriia bacterium]|nr:UPF0280 family protein [Coriobacteriia bacterium]
MVFEPRTYRALVDPAGLVTFEVMHAETDLQVSALRDLSSDARELVRDLRAELEAFIATFPRFAESYVSVDVPASAPAIALAMAAAARAAGVGPMAGVAGAFAEAVARGLEPLSAEVVVENGGDLYLMGHRERTVLLVAGDSALSGSVAIALGAEALPVAVCTSSGRVGPSVSYGSAHGATVLARSGALADAAASAVGNLVHGPDDIEGALARAREIPGVLGAVVIAGDHIGATGGIVRLVPVPGR